MFLEKFYDGRIELPFIKTKQSSSNHSKRQEEKENIGAKAKKRKSGSKLAEPARKISRLSSQEKLVKPCGICWEEFSLPVS